MTAMAEAVHTGSIYGSRQRRAAEPASTRTRVDYKTVGNPVLREVLPAFDNALLDDMVDPALARPTELLAARFVGGTETVKFVISGRDIIVLLTTSAVDPHELPARDAVMYVARTLGVPQRDVLRAAGIAPRTFHTWGKIVRHPRLSSQGRLWELVQLTEDLRELFGSRLRRWMRAPGRRALLAGSDPQQLLSQAMVQTTNTPTGPRLLTSAVGSETHDVGPATRPVRPGDTTRPARRVRVEGSVVAPDHHGHDVAAPGRGRTRGDAQDR